MREMSYWTVAASLFFSVSLFTSASEVVSSAFSLAGAGNPAVIEQGLSGLVSRMGGDVAVPKIVSEAAGKMVPASLTTISAARLQREHDFALKEGNSGTMSKELAGALGLTDGTKGYDMMAAAWEDDDKTLHLFNVGTDKTGALVITYKSPAPAYSINWLTDLNGKLIATTYSTPSGGTVVVPNKKYAAEFDGQLKFWDSIVPNGAPVATASTGS